MRIKVRECVTANDCHTPDFYLFVLKKNKCRLSMLFVLINIQNEKMLIIMITKKKITSASCDLCLLVNKVGVVSMTTNIIVNKQRVFSLRIQQSMSRDNLSINDKKRENFRGSNNLINFSEKRINSLSFNYFAINILFFILSGKE